MPVERKIQTSFASLALVCAIIVCATPGAAWADESDISFPYQAIVLKEDAPVRSGPGQVHYATDQLDQGATIEVHRHDPGGWCAVRPTKGSFSLVPAAAVDVIDDRVGEVIDSGTQAWVGTHLGAVEKPLWQVKLREGERVEILGEVSWPHPEGHSTIWYQIAPPAGEFRWMQISDLQLPPSNGPAKIDVAQSATTTNSHIQSLVDLPVVQPATHLQASPIAPAVGSASAPAIDPAVHGGVRLASATQSGNMNLGWRRSTRPIPNQGEPTATPANVAAVGAGNVPTVAQAGLVAPMQRIRVASNAPSAGFNEFARLPAANAQSFGRTDNRVASLPNSLNRDTIQRLPSSRLESLDAQLTSEMIREPGQWRIAPILDAAQRVYESATSANERLQASRVIEKCQNCLRVQAGYANVNAASGVGSWPGQSTRPSSTVGAGLKSVEQDVSFGATYDAHGWLNELVRKQGELEPEYVLQDRNGKITHHVIASAGLNLRRYLKSQVGIVGQRGYNHALNLDHVIADRVIVLQQSR